MSKNVEICKKVAVILDFTPPFDYTESISGVKNIMLSLKDAKMLISAYKYIDKRCEMVNEFIYKHAINYGPDPEVYSTYDVINSIVDLMERRVKLTRLKELIDEIVGSMKLVDRQILLIKMKYRTSVQNIQAILKLSSERTTFRRMESAINNFLVKINSAKYQKEIEEIMQREKWIPKTQPIVTISDRKPLEVSCQGSL